MKHAPIARSRRILGPAVLATFGLAQALITRMLPHRMQNRKCSQTSQKMIFFSSHCIGKGTDDIESGNHKRTSRAHHEPQRFDSKERVAMNTSLNHGSATIYQFPAGGRSALGGRRHGDTKSTGERGSLPVNETICSGSWYHQEAIDEAKPAWER
jgi:uncharacterized protein DUF2735